MIHPKMKSCTWTLGILWWLLCPLAHGETVGLPVNGSHVVDLARLLSPDDMAKLNETCETLQSKREIPMFVVTIESMAKYVPSETTIESFARDLFEQWGVDPAFAAAPHWRHGILFLISKNDRKARIELGMDWGLEHTQGATNIMERIIVPAFKAGEFSEGIMKGVNALESLDQLDPDVAYATPGNSAMLEFLGMSALMLVGFGLLYGALVFLASKLTAGGLKVQSHTTPEHFGRIAAVRAPEDASNQFLYEQDPTRQSGVYPNTSDTSTFGSSTGFDAGSASSSGGGFSDGGGATGSW